MFKEHLRDVTSGHLDVEHPLHQLPLQTPLWAIGLNRHVSEGHSDRRTARHRSDPLITYHEKHVFSAPQDLVAHIVVPPLVSQSRALVQYFLDSNVAAEDDHGLGPQHQAEDRTVLFGPSQILLVRVTSRHLENENMHQLPFPELRMLSGNY